MRCRNRIERRTAGAVSETPKYQGRSQTHPQAARVPTVKNLVPLLVTLGFSVVGVVGDYLLKLASGARNPLRSGWFYLGFAVYASTAFGWVYVMRHLKLATIGVVYSVSMILLLTAIGSLAFHESLSASEAAGIVLAVASLFLLMRFA